MDRGAFIIEPKEAEFTIDIRVDPAFDKEVPEDQAAVEADVRDFVIAFAEFQVKEGRTRSAFKQEMMPQVDWHFRQLVEAASIGMTGETARPLYARRRLEWLEKSFLTLVMSRLQRRYIRDMGITALAAAVVLYLAYLTASTWANWPHANAFLVLAGAVVGGWVSYSTRPKVINLDEMDDRDTSRTWGSIQLVTVSVISLILALLLGSGLLPFTVGDLDGTRIMAEPLTALTLGAVFGLTERTLPTRVLSRVSKIVEKRI